MHASRRPVGLIARTRRLFCWAALVSLAITLPGAAIGSSPTAAAGLAVASLTLIVVWVDRLRRGRVTIASDVAEAVASALFASCASAPELAFGFVFTALWQRSVYGTWTRGIGHAVLLVTALLTALVGWPAVPGHGPVDASALLGPLPLSFLISAVSRYLAQNLFAREQAGARQSALAALSTEMLGARDRDQIVAAAWVATRAICAATPHSHAVGVELTDSGLRVYSSTGPELPGMTWPTDGLDRSPEPRELPQETLAQLHHRLGATIDWVSLALPTPGPGLPARWLLVGEPTTGEVTTAVRAVTQVADLALRARRAHEELLTASRTDALTGLANRVAFTEELQARLPLGPAVLFCDLDGFKGVNDVLGHAAGDAVLVETAARLRGALRADDVCARLGGDEFAVIVATGSLELAQSIAQRLVERLAEPFVLADRLVSIGVSVGVAAALPGVDADDVLRRADDAMYRVKADGKSGYATYPC